MEFSEFLSKKRKENNLSIRQLALYSDVSASYLSQIENGGRGIPTPEILKKLHKPLKISYDELMQVAGYIEESNNTTIERQSPDESIFFFDQERITPEEREELKKHLEFLRYKAAQENEKKK